MPDIDYALAYDFHFADEPGVSYQLRFRHRDLSANNPLGQLIAEVVDHTRADNGRVRAISRPNIRLDEADAAVNRDDWPWIVPGESVSLDAIQARINRAGLS